jgi:hypothetical protein
MNGFVTPGRPQEPTVGARAKYAPLFFVVEVVNLINVELNKNEVLEYQCDTSCFVSVVLA